MGFFNSLAAWAIRLILLAGLGIVLWLGHSQPRAAIPVPQTSTTSQSGLSTTSPLAATSSPSKKVATSTPAKKPAAKPKPVATVSTDSTSSPQATSPPPVISNDTIQQYNLIAKSSLVNILCTSRQGNTLSYISGSGLLIDARGVILTNAHVAQFFLLAGYQYAGSTSCAVRTGNPAVSTYNAKLLYLPPLWIEQNAQQIASEQAVGTGERDYAFLLITSPTQFAPALPAAYAALPISTGAPLLNEPVLLAGYPAGFLSGNDLQRNLYSSSAVSSIQKLWTFNSADHVDLVSLGGTVVSQSGSSGGAVIDLQSGNLIAMIATESEGDTTAARDLRAITMFHINQSLGDDGKGNIATLLSGDLSAKMNDFQANIAPSLAAKLAAVIESAQ